MNIMLIDCIEKSRKALKVHMSTLTHNKNCIKKISKYTIMDQYI